MAGRLGACLALDALIGNDMTLAAGMIILCVLLAGIGAGTGTVTAGAGTGAAGAGKPSANLAMPSDVSGIWVGAAGCGAFSGKK